MKRASDPFAVDDQELRAAGFRGDVPDMAAFVAELRPGHDRREPRSRLAVHDDHLVVLAAPRGVRDPLAVGAERQSNPTTLLPNS
jgi:hypothetical protein